MADVIVQIKVMPESPELNLDELSEKINSEITRFGAEVHKTEREPIAFGLFALKIIFIYDEKKGDSEPLEKSIEAIKGIQSVEVVDVRRAFG